MHHLFVSDMDGTLLGSDSRVSARSADIISGLSRRGVAITVATARTPASVDILLADTFTSVPAVVMTGAALWDRSSGRYLNPVFIPLEAMPAVADAFRRCGVSPFIYMLGEDDLLTVHHSPQLNPHERKFYEERSSLPLKRFVFDYADPAPLAAPPILVFGMDEAERIEAVASILRADPRLSVSCYRDIFNPSVANVEVFGAEVSKAAAVRRLAAMVGADRVTVYGDNLNDLPMFEAADESVAVANAVPQVLEAADRVIGPNTSDAVALDILRIVENGNVKNC